MIGKTVEFNLGGRIATGVILDKALYNATTYYLIEHGEGCLTLIPVHDITRIVNPIMPPRGFKPPIETK